MHEVVWGNGNLNTVAGVVGVFGDLDEAERAAREFLLRHKDNPALGVWVRDVEDDVR